MLAVELGETSLTDRLGDFCLSLEAGHQGRNVSNVGGFQSKNLAAHRDPALSELMSLLHRPLAAFQRRRREHMLLLDDDITEDEGLCVAGRPEQIWVNVNRPGHHNRLHEHGPPLLGRAASGIYYPRAGGRGSEGEEEAAARSGGAPPPAVARFYDGAQLVEVKPRPGLLLLFPTDLPHEVDPVWPGAGPRASVAFNLLMRWLDSPLLRAASAGDAAEIERLADEGEDLDEGDAVLGLSPAHVAAEAGHLGALQALVARGADLSVISHEGWCPLGLAAAQGHLEVVRYLVGEGDSPSGFTRERADLARDAEEVDLTGGFAGLEGALYVASERGHQDVVDFLHGLAGGSAS